MEYRLQGRQEEASKSNLESRVLGRRVWFVPGEMLPQIANKPVGKRYVCEERALANLGYQGYELTGALVYVPKHSRMEERIPKQRL